MRTKYKQSRSKTRFWAAHFAAWEKSGLSQREYCRQCNLSLSTFTWWRRKLRRQEADPLTLVPVLFSGGPQKIGGAPAMATGLSLVVGRRCRIEIGADFHAETFTRLISVLEGQ